MFITDSTVAFSAVVPLQRYSRVVRRSLEVNVVCINICNPCVFRRERFLMTSCICHFMTRKTDNIINFQAACICRCTIRRSGRVGRLFFSRLILRFISRRVLLFNLFFDFLLCGLFLHSFKVKFKLTCKAFLYLFFGLVLFNTVLRMYKLMLLVSTLFMEDTTLFQVLNELVERLIDTLTLFSTRIGIVRIAVFISFRQIFSMTAEIVISDTLFL